MQDHCHKIHQSISKRLKNGVWNNECRINVWWRFGRRQHLHIIASFHYGQEQNDRFLEKDSLFFTFNTFFIFTFVISRPQWWHLLFVTTKNQIFLFSLSENISNHLVVTKPKKTHEFSAPKIGDHVICLHQRWAYFYATIASFSGETLEYTVNWDDQDPTGRVQSYKASNLACRNWYFDYYFMDSSLSMLWYWF